MRGPLSILLLFTLLPARLPAEEPCGSRAECQEMLKDLKQKLLVNEEELQLLRNRASELDEIERSINTGERAVVGEKQARSEKEHLILRRLTEEKGLRRKREEELDQFRGNLFFPGLGNYRRGEYVRASLWGGLFLASLAGLASSYAQQQQLRSHLASVSWNPLAYPAAEQRYNTAVRRTGLFGALTLFVYTGSFVDALHSAKREPGLQFQVSFLFD